jgi:DNA-binding XRE family transcriptional regulator
MRLGTQEAIDLGREVARDGRLKALRKRLGITRNAMAELLQTAWPTYAAWESRPVTLQLSTAARVGRFYAFALTELDLLEDMGVQVEDLVPFHMVATMLGLPQEQLLYRYRNGEIEAVDAGLLGLWMTKKDLAKLKSK